MTTHKYQLNYCEWRQPDGSLLRGFCLTEQTSIMKAPRFLYLDTNGVQFEVGNYLGDRVLNCPVLEFDRSETVGDLRGSLKLIAGLVALMAGWGEVRS